MKLITNVRSIFNGMDTCSKLYIILYTAVMFSGSTFLASFVMPLICVMILMLFCMSKVKGFQKNAFICKKISVIHVIMLAITAFMIYQLRFSFRSNTTLAFAERFIVYFMLLVIPSKMELNYRILKAVRWYSYPVALSILAEVLITGEKAGGLVGNYQFAGMMMSISFSVILIDYYFSRKRINLLGLGITFLALMTSGKRSFTLLSIGAYILASCFINYKKKTKMFLKLTSLLLVVVILAYLFIPSTRLVFNRFVDYRGDETYNGRTYYWVAAKQIYQNNKLTGIGMGCFSEYFDVYFHRLGNSEAYDAHNIYMQMIAELGIIGTGLFILLFISSLFLTFDLFRRKSIRQNKKCMYILCYSAYMQIWFIVYGLTGNPLYGAGQCFFYIGAIAMMLSVKMNMLKPKKFFTQ